jgi:glycosyltransferase involved in cell wall biosynthesis
MWRHPRWLRRRLADTPPSAEPLDAWRDTVLVVDVKLPSESLEDRYYAHDLGGTTVLRWAIDRFLESTGHRAPIVVCLPAAEQARAAAALEGAASLASVWASPAFGEARELLRAAAIRSAERLVFVDLSASLLPPAALLQSVGTHRSQRAQVSVVRGLPCTQPPVVADRWVLERVARGIHAGATVKSVLATCERVPFLQVRQVAPVAEQQQDENGWPFSPRFDTVEGVAILKEVVRRAAAPLADGDLLRIWTEVVRDTSDTELREARCRARTGPPTGTVRGPVLLAALPSALSGGEESCVVLAAAVRERFGREWPMTALVAQPGVFVDRLRAAGVHTIVPRRQLDQPSMANYLQCCALLDQIGPGIVHANSVLGVPLSCAIENRQVPLVQHVRVANERLFELAEQIRAAAAVIAVSRYVGQRVVRLGVDASKVHVIHNGVSPGFVAAMSGPHDPIRRQCGIADSAVVLLMVARFVRNKRHDVAIDVLARLRSDGDVHLLLVGEAGPGGGLLEQVRERIVRQRLTERVHFLGFRADMPALYAAADLVLFPSEDDPLPRAILEAMAARVPIVAALSGGAPELLVDADSGMLAPPGDADALAEAVRHLLGDAALRERLAAAAFRRASAQFTAAACAEKTAAVYQRVLSPLV